MATVTALLAQLVWFSSADFHPFAPGYGNDSMLLVDRRSRFCDVTGMDSLEGRSVSVALLPQLGDVSIVDGQLQHTYLAQVFDEVSRRAGFSWHATTAVVTKNTSSFDELVLASASKYDIVLAGVMSTPYRKKEGLSFGFPLFDASPVFVTRVSREDPPFFEVIFAFLKPFKPEFWYTLVFMFAATAVIYVLLEGGSDDLKDEEPCFGFRSLQAFWLSVGSFTGASGFSPSTNAGKVFVLCWTFCILLVASAYTANLATLLIVNSHSVSEVSNIAEAVAKKMPVCMVMKSGTASIVRELYPLAAFVDMPSGWQPTLMMDGTCVGAVTANWPVLEIMKRDNPKCQFDVRGKRLQEVHASYAALSPVADNNLNCIGKLLDVLDYHTHQLFRSGFVEEAYQEHLKKQGDQQCTGAAQAKQSDSLRIKDMGGILVIYAAVSLFALAEVLRRRSSSSSTRQLTAESGGSSEEDEKLA
eukprot:TRINITY_DN19156_c0_g2_i1.p1 TRINITY_DN19156_c0_g2~~TRINITY_DN19156_c0_g2_i1.p1  ORF type:complete len:484 (-),score=82.60 TRINITY_DN19156_c0_g2_i1:21-1436(-)